RRAGPALGRAPRRDRGVLVRAEHRAGRKPRSAPAPAVPPGAVRGHGRLWLLGCPLPDRRPGVAHLLPPRSALRPCAWLARGARRQLVTSIGLVVLLAIDVWSVGFLRSWLPDGESTAAAVVAVGLVGAALLWTVSRRRPGWATASAVVGATTVVIVATGAALS